ncbi:MAG: DNA polymerase III subunit delta' [Kordiimonadaceae bacterium]|nr:DNA polymerase III subunit delta' [Kordiimonadaceae bacterium]
MADAPDIERQGPRYTDQIFGHEAAERLFLEAFNSDRLHHAWLISGPKGIGKATLAWQFAKFLLTQTTNDGGPGLFGEELTTEAQTLHTDPESADIQRIKAGGHGGLIVAERSENEKTGKMRANIVIDDVRKVINFFAQTSAEGGWRVAIVDAADEMNSNAANALLKILEEPPEKAIIFLVAHSPGKLLPTIRSRCRTLKLQSLQEDSVKAVLAAKHPNMSMEALASTSMLADGAPGRAIELADLEGVALYREMAVLLAELPRINVPAVHAFAGQLSAIKADARYRAFIQIYLDWLQRLIRQMASGQPTNDIMEGESVQMARISSIAGVDQWLDLWEKMGEMVNRADAVNLDRKQVIVSLFTSIGALSRS